MIIFQICFYTINKSIYNEYHNAINHSSQTKMINETPSLILCFSQSNTNAQRRCYYPNINIISVKQYTCRSLGLARLISSYFSRWPSKKWSFSRPPLEKNKVQNHKQLQTRYFYPTKVEKENHVSNFVSIHNALNIITFFLIKQSQVLYSSPVKCNNKLKTRKEGADTRTLNYLRI